MNIGAYVLNSTRQLDHVSDLLAEALQENAPKIAEILGIDNLDITVCPFESGAAPKSGIGGYMLSSHRIELLVDSEAKELERIIERELPSVLAHELHHCARSRLIPKETTLGHNVLTEGLACHFEQRFNGGNTPSLFDEIESASWAPLFERMQPHLNDSEFSFDYWFLGEKPDELPKYAGYWVGYNLVMAYAQERGLSYEQLVGIEYSDILPSE